MGLFTNTQKETANSVYEDMKKYLVKKDGFKHITMVISFSKVSNKSFKCEDKYTSQLNEIIENMQNDGYEILNISTHVLQNQGFFKRMEGFFTVITYT